MQNLGAGAVTITPTTSTINGAATLVLATNQGCTIVSDGTNYQVSACTALGGTGTVTSITAGAGLSGGTITGSGTIAQTNLVNAQVGTSYTILSSDLAKLVTFSNGSAIAVTLPQATGSFTTGFFFKVQNLGAGTATITPTTSTINGAANIAVTTNQGCTIISDGTNWQVTACTAVGGSASGVSSITGTANQITASASTGAVTLSIPAVAAITTSLAVDGCTISSDKFCNAGTSTFTGQITANGRILGASQVYAGQNLALGWANADNMYSNSTGSIVFGNLASATPIAQTLSFSPASGTNIAGTSTIFVGSLATGSASSGGFTFQTGGAVAGSGTTVATATTALTIAGVTGAVALPLVTTGTNADFACFATGNVFTLQSSACTISSLRFKKGVEQFSGHVLPAIGSLDVDTFFYKAKNSDENANVQQLGLIAEDIAKKLPICAEYESDMKTPKSYKQECLIAVLVKGQQEQQKEIDELWFAVGALLLGLGGSVAWLKRAA